MRAHEEPRRPKSADGREPGRPLDPFAFPSETTGRFRMLVFAALMLAWGLTSHVIYVPSLTTDMRLPPEMEVVFEKFKERDFRNLSLEELVLASKTEKVAKWRNVYGLYVKRLLPSFFVMAIFLLAVFVLYRLHPVYLRHRLRTSHLDERKAPTVVRELRAFASDRGFSENLRFEQKPGFLDGLAFGLRGREILVLFGPPKFLESTWASLTRAIALHELGHIANHDIRNREITRAMWGVLLVFLSIGAISIVIFWSLHGAVRFPLFGSEFLSGRLEAISPARRSLEAAVKIVVMLATVWWIWAELIRVREFYADWRVAAWGEGAALLRRLEIPEARSRWWQRSSLWRHHPSNETRIDVLQRPRRLFELKTSLAFLTGLSISLAVSQMGPLVADLTVVARLVTSLVFFVLGPFALLIMAGFVLAVSSGIAYLIGSALGVQVQRESLADLAMGEHGWGYAKLFRPALWFALGVEAGLLFTPLSSIPLSDTVYWMAGWSAFFTGLVWLWLIYVRATSRLLIGSRVGREVPARLQRVLLALSAILLAVLMLPALAARYATYNLLDPERFEAMTPMNVAPEDHLFLFVATPIMFFAIALLFYVALTAVSLLVAGIGFLARSSRCGYCGESVDGGIAVGRRCESCREELAAWFYVDASVPTGRDF